MGLRSIGSSAITSHCLLILLQACLRTEDWFCLGSITRTLCTLCEGTNEYHCLECGDHARFIHPSDVEITHHSSKRCGDHALLAKAAWRSRSIHPSKVEITLCSPKRCGDHALVVPSGVEITLSSPKRRGDHALVTQAAWRSRSSHPSGVEITLSSPKRRGDHALVTQAAWRSRTTRQSH